METVTSITIFGLEFLSTLFIFVIGLAVLVVSVLFVVDVRQTRDAIRRNYPVIGRFRYLFSALGEFFRQYFFALDREEMPFNRAQRQWVYRSARGADNTVPFGSTQVLTLPGTPIFVNCPFPALEKDSAPVPPVVIGPGARQPYEASSIINISGMSYGALSRPAVRALSKGAALAGCWLNTGEGGLSPWHLEGGCDIVFQIGTAKFGVRHPDGGLNPARLEEIAALPQVRMFEVKLSQGAKPGKGGILPGVKVTPEIADIRGIPVGESALSPNRHIEIESVQGLLDFIHDLRRITGKPVGFKTVVGSTAWLESMCEEIARRGSDTAPDFVAVDGGDGGTGAAPMPLMDSVGLSIREALPVVIDILTRHGLRERIRVIASGKLVTPAEVAWAYCAGADFVVSARAFMLAIGCIQAMKCNKNTCPTGVTTHDPRLQKGLDPADKAVRVKTFVDKMRSDVGTIAHSCGVPHPRALQRFHVRIVQANGTSVPLDELYPPRVPKTANAPAA